MGASIVTDTLKKKHKIIPCFKLITRNNIKIALNILPPYRCGLIFEYIYLYIYAYLQTR